MNIISIQIDHNASACLFVDGSLVYYNQEERLSRQKKASGIPYCVLDEIKKITVQVDKVIVNGYDFTTQDLTIGSYMKRIGFTFTSNTPILSYHKPHHLTHAVFAFCRSGFEDSIVFVCDGKGSTFLLDNFNKAYETTSIFDASRDHFTPIFKRFHTPYKIFKDVKIVPTVEEGTHLNIPHTHSDMDMHVVSTNDIGHLYEIISKICGFGPDECGKLMGLHSYGKYNPNIPDLSQVITSSLDPIINEKEHPWFTNKNNLPDLAFHAQKTLENVMCNTLAEYAKKITSKNIILTGGVALNIVANSYLRQVFKEYNFYVEPLCGDEGNSIGGALIYHLTRELPLDLNSFKDEIFFGSTPEYTLNIFDPDTVHNATPLSISKLLSQGKLVAIFQGKSEGGPRALGNRSILFNPTIPNGKEIVNRVKKREWFRPFACTILKDKFSEWFNTIGINESPYMMYSFTVREEKKNLIPAVIHVDNTCRVQTVEEKFNYNFYYIINEFYKLTGIPLVLNTSFNLAGDPLVETLEDAKHTLINSELEYLYLADINKLIYIPNEIKKY